MNIKILLPILLVLAVAAAIGYGYLIKPMQYPPVTLTQVRELDATTTQGSASDSFASSTPRQAPSGFKEFSSSAFHFSLLYPDDLEMKQESDYGGEAFTVVFFNQTKGEALQIYMQPYTQPTVTPERFKLDAPYSSTTEPVNITLAGAKGLEFVGKSQGNPDMFEIWFINQGLLYEVTAPASLEEWVKDILQTWKFV